MVELEKRGVPTVSWLSPGFLEDAKMSTKIFGAKGLGLALLSRGTVWEHSEQTGELVAAAIDQVIGSLTKPVMAFEAEEKKVAPSEVLTIQGDDSLDAIEKINRRFLSEGWGDGFPIVPPTPQTVEGMLAGTRLSRDGVIAVLEPGYGMATVEKIAINAVMAGCRPEHMSLLITAVRCLGNPRITLRRWIMSTGAQGPFTLINGPIAKKLAINSKCSALDPGSDSYANMVIGRALSLVILNIAHGYPGAGSMSTIGNPMNYSMCVAENEEDSPWEPYHVEKGFDKDTSTVSVMFVRGGITFADQHSKTAESIAQGQAWIASRPGNLAGLWLTASQGEKISEKYGTRNLFLVNPSHARVLAKDGWDKKKLRQYLYENAKLPLKILMFGKELSLVKKEHPQLFTCLEESPEIPLPVVDAPEHFEVAVVGGAGPCSSYFEGGGEFVTLPIEE